VTVPGEHGRLDYADRWLRDGLSVLHPPFSAYQIAVDMTAALERLDQLRRQSVSASTTHLVIQAAARALAANPQLHQLIAGNTRVRPAQVDIGLSIAGETFVSPVLVIEAADRKSLVEIVAEVARRSPVAREADARLLHLLRRWGWLIPVQPLRRAILRLLFRSPAFRRKGVGTFQITTVPTEWAMTSTFSTSGVLVAGQVSLSVVALNGAPAVRPVMRLTLCADHGVWDGRAAARLLAAVREELEARTDNEPRA
jgi:pyruvate/2-oxoglutarate dehydrogenase complex dihydrolipoamide acyltransferase (E2) component